MTCLNYPLSAWILPRSLAPCCTFRWSLSSVSWADDVFRMFSFPVQVGRDRRKEIREKRLANPFPQFCGTVVGTSISGSWAVVGRGGSPVLLCELLILGGIRLFTVIHDEYSRDQLKKQKTLRKVSKKQRRKHKKWAKMNQKSVEIPKKIPKFVWISVGPQTNVHSAYFAHSPPPTVTRAKFEFQSFREVVQWNFKEFSACIGVFPDKIDFFWLKLNKKNKI